MLSRCVSRPVTAALGAIHLEWPKDRGSQSQDTQAAVLGLLEFGVGTEVSIATLTHLNHRNLSKRNNDHVIADRRYCA